MLNKFHIKSVRKNIFRFLMSIGIKLINNIKPRIDFLIKELSSIIKPRIDFLISFIVIRLPLLSTKRKIKICSIKYLNFLNDKDIKKLKLGSDKGQLALKILNTFSELDFELIEKICWLISYSRYKHFQLEILFKHLDQFKLGEQEIKKLLILMLPPFTHFGDYTRFEELLIYLKLKLDKEINRPIGIYKESSFFTAIGHMSELTYLMKAVELKLININDTEINLAITNTPISNIEYSNLLIEKCKRIGLNIKYYDCSYFDLEPSMELYPISSIGKYIFGRHIMGLINCYWEILHGNTYIFPSNKQIEVAKNVFKKIYGYVPSNFVGMHFRLAKDSKSLRNSESKSSEIAIDEISKLGLTSILIGTKSSPEKFKASLNTLKVRDKVLDTTKLFISRYERECLQLYVWSHSRFFIGCLSGGTFPAGTFGTPTLWLDCHPQKHFRIPFKFDHMLTKRIFYKKENRFLHFKEIFEDKHISSQSENSSYVQKNGYKVIGCDPKEIKKSIHKMYLQTENKQQKMRWDDIDKNKCISAMQRLKKEGRFKEFEFGASY